MIGYVNADSKRRGMNSLLWTLLVIFVPKALGFIAYFLLRKPLVTPCPNCSTPIGADFRFCPKCGYAVTPTLRALRMHHQRDYVVCPYCGKPVTGGAGIAPSVSARRHVCHVSRSSNVERCNRFQAKATTLGNTDRT